MAFFSEDYSTYADTKSFMTNVGKAVGGTGGTGSKYNDGHLAYLLSIDPNVKYNGHATLKYSQPGGTSASPQLWPSLPKSVRGMWMRVKVRFSPGYTTAGTTTNSARAYKILGWGWTGTNGRGSLEYTNTSQYTYEVNTVLNGVQTSYAEIANRLVKTEWTDGNWYDIIVYYKETSTTTAISKWWFAQDGQTPVLQATLNTTLSSGQNTPINRVLLGLNFNQQRSAGQDQALWYGQWEVIDANQYADPFGLF
jgi:hypothetical protein